MKIHTLEAIVSHFDARVDRGIRISRDEYGERWSKVQAAMQEKGYDLAYACGSELDRSDLAWLAGIFDPIIERYGILIPAEGRPVVVAGSEGGHVVMDCLKDAGADLALLKEFQISDEDYRFAEFTSVEQLVDRLVPAASGTPLRVALLSSSQFIPHDHVGLFCGRFGAENVVYDVELLQLIKYEKSPAELAVIGTANTIADAAFLAMLAVLEPGIRELDVAAAADYVMKRLGAGRTGFPTIVSSGDRGRTVLGPATHRRIGRGEFVSMGVSPTFNGYHGIMRRTVKVGEGRTAMEREFLQALEGLYHAVMKGAQEAAEQGLPASSIDQKGKEYLEGVRIKDLRGRVTTPREPYTFIHNTGCSECQEGYGAVTPNTARPLGDSVALMIDVALMGFDARGDLVFPVEYAVIEDCFWKRGRDTAVYNRMPLDVQELAGGGWVDIPAEMVNPYFRPTTQAGP